MSEAQTPFVSRRSALALALGGTAALLSGCWSPDLVTRNIRVIVQAEVAGKVVEGSTVMSLRWQAGDNTRMYIASNAEAVVLELPAEIGSHCSDNAVKRLGRHCGQRLCFDGKNTGDTPKDDCGDSRSDGCGKLRNG